MKVVKAAVLCWLGELAGGAVYVFAGYNESALGKAAGVTLFLLLPPIVYIACGRITAGSTLIMTISLSILFLISVQFSAQLFFPGLMKDIPLWGGEYVEWFSKAFLVLQSLHFASLFGAFAVRKVLLPEKVTI